MPAFRRKGRAAAATWDSHGPQEEQEGSGRPRGAAGGDFRRGPAEVRRAPGREAGKEGIPRSLKAGRFCVPGGREYLTGFHKRKVERRKAALEEIKRKLKEEQRKMKEEVSEGSCVPPPQDGQ